MKPLIIALLVVLTVPSRSPAQAISYLSANALQQELDSPLQATRPRASLRDTLKMLSDNRRIAILLDRRIDPDQLLQAAIDAPYFDEGIAKLVEPFGAEVRIVADTLYICPAATADTIRTRVEVAVRAMDHACAGDVMRKTVLKRNVPITWQELTAPRGIALSLASRYKLTIENPEAIPHDLWGAGVICSADAAEGLALIAAQFDLDLQFVSADAVRLVPADPHPKVELAHRVRKLDTLQQVLETLRKMYPEREFTVRGNSLSVEALLEEHDEMDLLLGNKPTRKAPVPAKSVSLASRRMSLEMVDQTLPSLLKMLTAQGIQIEYDEAALRQASIPLDRPLSLKLKDATIQQLMDAAAVPLGVKYSIDGEKVLLGPAPR